MASFIAACELECPIRSISSRKLAPASLPGLGEALQMPAQLANDLSRRGRKLARLFGQPQMLLCELG